MDNFSLVLQRAREGDVHAQWITFCCYYNGEHGIPKDVKEAIRWIRLSAQQGNVESQYNLALLYLEGKDVEQNSKEYLRLVTLAANQGYHYAQASLGAALQLGRDDVPKDEKEAIKFLSLAANQNNANAQYRLGTYHYQHGHLSEAKRYFILSSAGRNKDATGALQALTNPKSILPQTFSALHSHILTWTCDVVNHYCDTCRKSFKVTHYFRCAGCDFDLCVPCFLI
jgi:TPR repeat protein